MIMYIQNLVKLCLLVLKILSRNEILTSIKGHNSVAYLRNLTLYKTNLDIINVTCIQNLVKFCPLVLKILSGNKILTPIKGHYSVANLHKMIFYNPNLDLVNGDVYTNFG